MTSYYSGRGRYYRQEELARLVLILVTPDPPTGASSTSNSSICHAIYGTIAKDALLLVLEGIVESSDAFPPLKSAASGLLFFATSADVSTWAACESTPDVNHLDRWPAATRSKSAIFTSGLRGSLRRSNAVPKQALHSLSSIKKSSKLLQRKSLRQLHYRIGLTHTATSPP